MKPIKMPEDFPAEQKQYNAMVGWQLVQNMVLSAGYGNDKRHNAHKYLLRFCLATLRTY